MRVKEDAVCKICKKVFCCAKCRKKHEIKTHAIIVRKTSEMNATSNNNNELKLPEDSGNDFHRDQSQYGYVICPICESRPFVFSSEVYEELLEHISQNHLPLHCRKCLKIYENLDDLKSFSKCINASGRCDSSKNCCSVASDQTCDSDSSKVTVTKLSPKKLSTISTQTSPMQKFLNDTNLTPISIINLRWKAKSKIQEELISDSVSSLKNCSSINSSMRRSIGTEIIGKAKLIRSTSTPVQLVSLAPSKPCEQAFNGSNEGHVSSIYSSSSCDSDTSPALPTNNGGTPRNTLDNFNRYRKVGGRPRLSAVTPLRQVMSKSIQKAFAEHGAMPSKGTLQPRLNIFDSINSSSESSGQVAPLDLRSSPVIRRTQSANDDSSFYLSRKNEITKNQPKENRGNHREVFLCSHKETTESIIITHSTHSKGVAAEYLQSNNFNDQNFSKKNASKEDSGGFQQTDSSSRNGSTGSSVFKSCQSVEIITSTEMSFAQEDLGEEIVETVDKLKDLPSFHSKNIHNLMPITPICRQSSSIVQKKLIKFETPRRDVKSIIQNQGKMSTYIEEKNRSSSPGEEFFTPNSTPTDKSPEMSPNSEKRRQLATRNLNRGFSPSIRKSLKNCAHSTAFSRIENDSMEDEVFLSEGHSPIKLDCAEAPTTKGNLEAFRATNRLWSLMSSVMRIPSLVNQSQITKDPELETDYNSNSIIKRCASIAGSLVRSKSLVEEEQLQSLKRKRTYTADHSVHLPHIKHHEIGSPNASSSKRFRIQGRKPIERMRKLT